MYGKFASIKSVFVTGNLLSTLTLLSQYLIALLSIPELEAYPTEQLIPTVARNVCIYICIVIVLRYSDSMAYVVMFIQICMRGTHRCCSMWTMLWSFLFYFD